MLLFGTLHELVDSVIAASAANSSPGASAAAATELIEAHVDAGWLRYSSALGQGNSGAKRNRRRVSIGNGVQFPPEHSVTCTEARETKLVFRYSGAIHEVDEFGKTIKLVVAGGGRSN